MEFKRQKYLQELINSIDNGMIKIITGVRRCGKTYLLFNLFYSYLKSQNISDDRIIQISLDSYKNAEFRNVDKLYEHIKSKLSNTSQKYYLFLDEAQYAISNEDIKNKDKPLPLYSVLNEFLSYKNVDIYVTGSNSKFLSNDVMTEFRGRGWEIHISPLSFSEFAENRNAESLWKDYVTYGGFPQVANMKTHEEKSNYLTRLYSEIYIKDIVERYNIRNPHGITEIMKILSSSIGSLTNERKISDTFKSNKYNDMSIPTVTNYINMLIDTFIINRAERYDIKGRKYINAPYKYYYTDIGLRNSIVNFRQTEVNHIMENIIYNELIYKRFNVDVGVVIYNDGKTKKRLEVDFVCNKGDRRYYIQSALHIDTREKKEQESKPLKNIPDNFKKIIVVNDSINPWTTEDGIQIVGITDFLMNENILE